MKTATGRSPVAETPATGGLVGFPLTVSETREWISIFPHLRDEETNGNDIYAYDGLYSRTKRSFRKFAAVSPWWVIWELSKGHCIEVSSKFFQPWLSKYLFSSFQTISAVDTVSFVLVRTYINICLAIDSDCIIRTNWISSNTWPWLARTTSVKAGSRILNIADLRFSFESDSDDWRVYSNVSETVSTTSAMIALCTLTIRDLTI